MGRVFSYEICEILKNAFLTEHLRATASNCQTEKWVWIFGNTKYLANWKYKWTKPSKKARFFTFLER